MGSRVMRFLLTSLSNPGLHASFRNLPLRTVNRLQSLQTVSANEVMELSSESTDFAIRE